MFCSSAVNMSRAHENHRAALPFFGNPFRVIRHRKPSHLSPKLASLQDSFEKTLALILQKVKPKDASEIFTLAWMKQAVDSLSEAHSEIANLITELEFPVSDWEEKWIDIYLDSSVKLLDICLALSAELARLDQGQLLLQYAVHVVDSSEKDSMSVEKLERAHKSVQGWVEKLESKSPKLERCSSILNALAGSLFTGKVRDSAKGRVLLGALYGVKVVTILIGGALISVLSGSLAPLVELQVFDNFAWYDAFIDLKNMIYKNVHVSALEGKASAVQELKAVEDSVRNLSLLMRHKEGCMQVESRGVDNGTRQEEDSRKFRECISDLKENAERLRVGLDLLSKQVEDFFQVVLSGRDALLCNLRVCNANVLKS
jgi:Protein BYPASS1-related